MLSDKETILTEIFTSAMKEAISIIDRNMKKWGNNVPCNAEAGVYKVIGEDEMPKCMSWYVGFGMAWQAFAHSCRSLRKNTAFIL